MPPKKQGATKKKSATRTRTVLRLPSNPLPREIRDQITDEALRVEFTERHDPRLYNTARVTEYPRHTPLQWDQILCDDSSRRAMGQVLARQWVWINLRVMPCNRVCQGQGEDPVLFNTWWRKLRTYTNHHFHEVPIARLNAITDNRTPVIEVKVACCDAALISTPIGIPTTRTELEATFAAGPLINHMFASLMCKINKRDYNIFFSQHNIAGTHLENPARDFMTAIHTFVRGSGTDTSVGPSIVPLIVPYIAPSASVFERQIISWLAVSLPTPGPAGTPVLVPHPQGIMDLADRINNQIIEIGRIVHIQQYPVHFMLPWVLDVILLYEEDYDFFSSNYDETRAEHQLLASGLGSLIAYASSGLAQYLLAQANTFITQRHYTIPNVFPHDQLKFESGEYFWRRLINSISFDSTKQLCEVDSDYVRDCRHDNPEFWCAVSQGLAELCLAFARAAIVVGDDDDQLMRHGPDSDLDPMPDIRENTYNSRAWTVPNQQIWHTRFQAVSQHLSQARQFITTVEGLIEQVQLPHQARIIAWLQKYECLWRLINQSLPMMHENEIELALRAEDRHIQFEAQAPIHPRYNLRRRARDAPPIPPPRPVRPLQDPNTHLIAPFLTIQEIQSGSLIEFRLPPFNDDTLGMLRWNNCSHNLHPQDDGPQFN